MKTKGGRRRGAVLEHALLAAAFEELMESGYANFTMDRAAARTRTSRSVLYRRWPDRAALAVAAIGHYYAANPTIVPDLGSFRKELTSFLQQSTARGARIQVKVILQMGDYFSETGSTLAQLRKGLLADEDKLLNVILDRAAARGELDPQKLTRLVRALPGDWARNEVMIRFRAVSPRAVSQFLDQIFLPLVGARGKAGAPAASEAPRRRTREG